jgi:hypothetical protein
MLYKLTSKVTEADLGSKKKAPATNEQRILRAVKRCQPAATAEAVRKAARLPPTEHDPDGRARTGFYLSTLKDAGLLAGTK